MNEKEKFQTSWRSGNEIELPLAFDHHCPECGDGLNFHKDRCLMRQKDPHQKFCFKGCKSGHIKNDRFGPFDSEYWVGENLNILNLLKKHKTRPEIMKMLNTTQNKVDLISKNAKKANKLK